MANDENTDISIAAFNGWIDAELVSHLTKYALEDQGYFVSVEYFDAAPGFIAVTDGDVDLLASSMLPTTHAAYLDDYGDDLESMGCWFDEAVNTIAVNEDSPAQTIGDLKDMADEYGNRIVGIEPGAGHMAMTKDVVMPTYGLDDLELVASSTPAMLAEVDRATKSGENIAVTMWHPHWAYDPFPLRDLEDPEGAFGDPEKLITFSRVGFADDNPKAAQLMQNFAMDNERFTELANLMANESEYNNEDHEAAVAEWAADNADFFEDWKAGALEG